MPEKKEAKYYESARRDLIRLIPQDAKHILDVGCGAGALGAAIKEEKGGHIEMTGIELDIYAADKAKKVLNKVIVGDTEAIELPFPKEYFDCIIYGDVLEHLIDPWGTLVKHKAFLKSGGSVIASIPNIAHYRIIKMLGKKEWNYDNAGIIDKTHLRFFTIKSIKKMFDEADFKILKIENRIGASNSKKFLNKIFFNLLLDKITEQYVILAQTK